MSKMRAIEPDPDGIMQPRADADDDVEGHRMVSRAVEPDGLMKPRNDGVPEGITQRRADADEDDVEGHFGRLRSPQSRGE